MLYPYGGATTLTSARLVVSTTRRALVSGRRAGLEPAVAVMALATANNPCLPAIISVGALDHSANAVRSPVPFPCICMAAPITRLRAPFSVLNRVEYKTRVAGSPVALIGEKRFKPRCCGRAPG